MKNPLMAHIEAQHLNPKPPQFEVGDIVDVHQRIVEGDKERIQVFSGTVIMKKGRGINEMFTVRRSEVGVERIFPLHSPFIAKVVVKRGGETRRAKLFYLRDRVGKAVKLTEKRKATKREPGGETGTSVPTEPAGATRELAASAT